MSAHASLHPGGDRRTMLAVLAAVLALGASAVGAPAQVAQITVGDTVRVDLGDDPTVYEYRGLRGDTLFLHRDESPLRVPLGVVSRIDVRTPKPQGEHVLRSVRIGAGVGGLLGFLVGTIVEGDCQGGYCGLGPALAGGAGVLAGSAVGLAVGLNTTGYQWTPVRQLGPAAMAPRTGVRVAIRWRP